MWGFLLSMLSGALMSLQGVFDTQVTDRTSIWVAAGWVQLTAFLACAVAWFFTGRKPVADLFQVRPWYLLLGGVMGAFITITVIQGMQALGPARATLLIVITQLAVSYGVELLGLFGVERAPFRWSRLFGLLLAVGGFFLFEHSAGQ
ncbi:MAG: DMT family transporter [Lachnospiraceae bacterium]|nr:DMT family transporter [Lachnospiraceae bacterium]